ncbi:hypothetical protein H2200_009731 [Cladophialophora chaetospira]|uniref:F-box domain-containing protein n=1 Tax=Cladophialophora chaetospira TaxID=386627 RepID=A0AA38X3B2_9EURO|nr:hypothetical protein H2200_009731 [Cladophialophora chaetospira]
MTKSHSWHDPVLADTVSKSDKDADNSDIQDEQSTDTEDTPDTAKSKLVTDLPVEILLQIAAHLRPESIKNAIYAFRAFHQAFQQELYKRVYWNFDQPGDISQMFRLDTYTQTFGHAFEDAYRDQESPKLLVLDKIEFLSLGAQDRGPILGTSRTRRERAQFSVELELVAQLIRPPLKRLRIGSIDLSSQLLRRDGTVPAAIKHNISAPNLRELKLGSTSLDASTLKQLLGLAPLKSFIFYRSRQYCLKTGKDTQCGLHDVYAALRQAKDSLEHLILIHEHGTNHLKRQHTFNSLVSFRELKTLAIDASVLIGRFFRPGTHPVPYLVLKPRKSLAGMLPEYLEALTLIVSQSQIAQVERYCNDILAGLLQDRSRLKYIQKTKIVIFCSAWRHNASHILSDTKKSLEDDFKSCLAAGIKVEISLRNWDLQQGECWEDLEGKGTWK